MRASTDTTPSHPRACSPHFRYENPCSRSRPRPPRDSRSTRERRRSWRSESASAARGENRSDRRDGTVRRCRYGTLAPAAFLGQPPTNSRSRRPRMYICINNLQHENVAAADASADWATGDEPRFEPLFHRFSGKNPRPAAPSHCFPLENRGSATAARRVRQARSAHQNI